jgi:hypothetical protein
MVGEQSLVADIPSLVPNGSGLKGGITAELRPFGRGAEPRWMQQAAARRSREAWAGVFFCAKGCTKSLTGTVLHLQYIILKSAYPSTSLSQGQSFDYPLFRAAQSYSLNVLPSLRGLVGSMIYLQIPQTVLCTQGLVSLVLAKLWLCHDRQHSSALKTSCHHRVVASLAKRFQNEISLLSASGKNSYSARFIA